jgi:hypothetical protein
VRDQQAFQSLFVPVFFDPSQCFRCQNVVKARPLNCAYGSCSEDEQPLSGEYGANDEKKATIEAWDRGTP